MYSPELFFFTQICLRVPALNRWDNQCFREWEYSCLVLQRKIWEMLNLNNAAKIMVSNISGKWQSPWDTSKSHVFLLLHHLEIRKVWQKGKGPCHVVRTSQAQAETGGRALSHICTLASCDWMLTTEISAPLGGGAVSRSRAWCWLSRCRFHPPAVGEEPQEWGPKREEPKAGHPIDPAFQEISLTSGTCHPKVWAFRMSNRWSPSFQGTTYD